MVIVPPAANGADGAVEDESSPCLRALRMGLTNITMGRLGASSRPASPWPANRCSPESAPGGMVTVTVRPGGSLAGKQNTVCLHLNPAPTWDGFSPWSLCRASY